MSQPASLAALIAKLRQPFPDHLAIADDLEAALAALPEPPARSCVCGHAIERHVEEYDGDGALRNTFCKDCSQCSGFSRSVLPEEGAPQEAASTSRFRQDDKGDWACEHGTASDVHCCNCHNGFLFDSTRCVCGMTVSADGRIEPSEAHHEQAATVESEATAPTEATGAPNRGDPVRDRREVADPAATVSRGDDGIQLAALSPDEAQLKYLRERLEWYRGGCQGLEDIGEYHHHDLASDALADFEQSLSLIARLRAVPSCEEKVGVADEASSYIPILIPAREPLK